MKIKVPFYQQTTNLNCGPTVLKMIFSYFGKNYDLKKLEELSGLKKGKAISTIKLAIAASNLKFQTKLFSKHIYFNKENLKLDFYKQYSDNIEESNHLLKEAEKRGVKLCEKSLDLTEILSYLNKNTIPIVLLDWNIIQNKEGYQGHFVPVVGYDKNSIFIHNSSLSKPQKFLPIKKELFDKARKSKGTDEDILLISTL